VSRNVRAPIALDALHSVWPIASADGIICINVIHISPWDATVGLIKGAAAILPSKSPMYLYGLRDFEAVAATAQTLGFSAPVITEVPANNLSVAFRRM
jgi:Protein of unknown function (DUF938)